MKVINQFYKLSELYRNGVFIFICLIIAIIGSLFIPEFRVSNVDKQLYGINGPAVKFEDTEMVDHFFNSIKSNNGILILGTSESGNYKTGNYFHFLNDDPTLADVRFSVIGGAGRTCGLHIPLFLRHREAVKGLRVYYFVNPIYWRVGLSTLNKVYWIRDHNYISLTNIQLTPDEQQKYFKPVNEYISSLSTSEKMMQYSEFYLHSFLSKYNQDLSYLISPEKYMNSLEFCTIPKGLKHYPNLGVIDSAAMNLSWNITNEYFLNKGYSSADTINTHRTIELESFIRLCSDLDVDITYILGPLNKKYIEKHESFDNYRDAVSAIRNVLKTHNASFIDLSDLSEIDGAFNDLQHHSSYGAYLIYQRIKSHLYEQ